MNGPITRYPHITNGDNFLRKIYYRSIFSGFDTIVELGVATGETAKIFIECKPKKVIGVDISDELLELESVNEHAEKFDVDFEFIKADDLTIDPIPCDVLFIDTSHEEEQTYQELCKFASHVNHYIALHDIVPEWGTLDGYNRWKEEFGEDWEEHYRDYQLCGLLVIKRKDSIQ